MIEIIDVATWTKYNFQGCEEYQCIDISCQIGGAKQFVSLVGKDGVWKIYGKDKESTLQVVNQWIDGMEVVE